MPRTGSTYAVPTGTQAVSGGTISSTAYNNFLSDLVNNALNFAWPTVYGGTGTNDGSSLLPNGSSSTPSVRFQNETNSGFYRVGAGDIGVSIGGNKVLDIVSTGMVFAPNATLSLTGSNLFYAPIQIVSTDSGSGTGPVEVNWRNSASPAASDNIGQYVFYGQDSANNQTRYAALAAIINSPTDGAESGSLEIDTVQSGVGTKQVTISDGMYLGTATGSDKGQGTINATGYYLNGAPFNGGATAGTPTATTSGTSITYSSLPSTIRRLTFQIAGVSTNGTSDILLRIGSGSVSTSGYLSCTASSGNGGSPAASNFTNGFSLTSTGIVGASSVFHGNITLTLENATSHIYTCSGAVSKSDSAVSSSIAGSITLSGTMDRVVLTTAGGTDTFDAGSVNILYE